MIPVSLSIKGLYSYQQEQKIEFNKLLEGQLFGIFGAVGSGKSSILEAISFAFLNNDENEYWFTVRGKRNTKNIENVNTLERKAYKKVNNDWHPLESASAEHIIGLSYDNFRRTIIIPQGKFQEFLQLGDRDRTNMLKEIFQLNKYEFFYQTTALEKKNNEAIFSLQGALSEFESVNAELIFEKDNLLKQIAAELAAIQDTHKKIEQEVKQQEDSQKLFAELTLK